MEDAANWPENIFLIEAAAINGAATVYIFSVNGYIEYVKQLLLLFNRGLTVLIISVTSFIVKLCYVHN